jgi:hypothetical protein
LFRAAESQLQLFFEFALVPLLRFLFLFQTLLFVFTIRVCRCLAILVTISSLSFLRRSCLDVGPDTFFLLFFLLLNNDFFSHRS